MTAARRRTTPFWASPRAPARCISSGRPTARSATAACASRATTWTFDPIRDTSVRSDGHDVGPSLAAANDEEIHVVAPTGAYGLSKDGGARWLRGSFPSAGGNALEGRQSSRSTAPAYAHVAYTGVVRGPTDPSESRAERRLLGAALHAPHSGWDVDRPAQCAGRRARPGRPRRTARTSWSTGSGSRSTARTTCMPSGTVRRIRASMATTSRSTRVAMRPARARGATAGRRRVLLYQTDKARGENFAYAPAMSFDGDTVVAVTFYEVQEGQADARLRQPRAHRAQRRPRRPADPADPMRACGDRERPQGRCPRQLVPVGSADCLPPGRRTRLWLDVLHTFEAASSTRSPNLIVYQRIDMTGALTRPR